MHAGKEMACRVFSDTQRKQLVRDGFVKLEHAIHLSQSERRAV
jgi:hypothetical protein